MPSAEKLSDANREATLCCNPLIGGKISETEKKKKFNAWLPNFGAKGWGISLGFGMIMLYASGMISLLVPTLTAFGYDVLFGVGLLSGMWFIGLLGHYLIGVLDVKLGSKKTSVSVIVVLALSGLLLFFFGANAVACAVAVACLLFGMSGAAIPAYSRNG